MIHDKIQYGDKVKNKVILNNMTRMIVIKITIIIIEKEESSATKTA